MKDINILKDIELFLLDMDGTIYLGEQIFDGSLDFINKIIKTNRKYVFMTNNSSKNKLNYVEKLNRLGIPANEENVFTSGMATGYYLNEYYPGKRVYLAGTKSLEDELRYHYHINLVEDNPEVVVMGFDRELNYKKLENVCEALDNGAIFIATNPDLVCPIENKRYIPDCGSMCIMIENATKRKPKYIGKPDPMMIQLLSKKFNIPVEKIAVIGDRVYTDIASGFNAKANTICVLSGESTMETINNSEIKPDFIFNSVKDLIDLI